MLELLGLFIVCVASVVWWPELLFVLFLNAGAFKGAPFLMELQKAYSVDATLALECLSGLGIVTGLILGRLKISQPSRVSLVPFLLLIVVAAASLGYTPGPIYGADKLARLCVITAYAFWAPALAFGTVKSIHRLLTAWISFALFIVGMSLAGGFQSSVLFRQAFGDSSGYLMVSYCAAQTALIGAVYAGDAGTSWTRRLIFILIALAASAGALLSGSRAGPVALALTFVVLLLAVGWRSLRRDGAARLRFGHLVVTVLLGLALLWLVAGQRDAFSGFLDCSNLLYADGRTLEVNRLEMTSLAAKLMLTHPLGTGLGGFTYYYLGWDQTRGAFAHNIFLEIGSELGWVGLAAFLTLCWNGLRPFAQLVRGRDRGLPTSGIVLTFLFIYMLLVYQFHGDLNDARVLWAWCGALFAFQAQARPDVVSYLAFVPGNGSGAVVSSSVTSYAPNF